MCHTSGYRIMGFAAGLLLAASVAGGADLHFIVLADTNDVSIGTIDDLNNARTWAESIASATGLTLNFQSLTGAQLTIENTRTLLNGVTADADDVIYFFYSGHGGNPGNLTWPVLYFTNSPEIASDVSFDEVVEVLQPKNPRLLVVLADCCNNYPDQAAYPFPAVPKPTGPEYTLAFQRLFVDYQGSVLASGCKPGQYSLGAQGEGGLFINNLMKSFYSLAPTTSVLTWEDVLTKTQADTKAEAERSGETQEPQYLVQGGLVASQTPTDLNLNTGDDQVGDGTLTGDDVAPAGDGDDSGDDDPDEVVLPSLPASGGMCGAAGAVPLFTTFALLSMPFITCAGRFRFRVGRR